MVLWSTSVEDDACVGEIPRFVHDALYVLKKSLPLPGLFAALKECPSGQLDQGVKDLDSGKAQMGDVHPASLIRGVALYFRRIADPILTDKRYQQFLFNGNCHADEYRRAERLYPLFYDLSASHPGRFATFALFVDFLVACIETKSVTLNALVEEKFLGRAVVRPREATTERGGPVDARSVGWFFRTVLMHHKLLFNKKSKTANINVPIPLMISNSAKDKMPLHIAEVFEALPKSSSSLKDLATSPEDTPLGILRTFLSNLYEPLTTYHASSRFKELVMDDEEPRIHMFKLLVDDIPESHRLISFEIINRLDIGSFISMPKESLNIIGEGLFGKSDASDSSITLLKIWVDQRDVIAEPYPVHEFANTKLEGLNDAGDTSYSGPEDEDDPALLKEMAGKLSEIFGDGEDGSVGGGNSKGFRELLVQPGHHLLSRMCRAITSSDAQDRLAHALWVLFDGNNPNDTAFTWLVEEEVQKTKRAPTLFRINSVPTKIFTQHATNVGKKYLQGVFRNPLKHVDMDNLEKYEVDPTKVNGRVDLLIHQDELIWITNVFLSYLITSTKFMPLSLRVAVNQIVTKVDEKFPNFASVSVGGFVILRFLSPALIMPDGLGLTGKVTPLYRRMLVLISKTVQTLANNLEFGSRASFMRFMNGNVRRNQHNMQTFLKSIPVDPNKMSAPSSEFSTAMRAQALETIFTEAQRKKDQILSLLVGEGENAALAAEESKATYDVVVSLSAIEEVIPPPEGTGNGWKVTISPGMRYTFENNSSGWNSSVVAVLGLYNKGKTYVLNSLTSLKLASDFTAHTEGLSFKMVKNKTASHILLDTAGFFSPVKIESKSQTALMMKKATDMFIEDVVFHLSDFFLVVLTDLTSLDQEYILKLILKLRSRPEKVQQLFIVHNLRDAHEEESLRKMWKEQVLDIYQQGEVCFEYVATDDPETGKLVEKEIEWFNAGVTRHVFLANGESEFGKSWNPWVFALLKQWLAVNFVPIKRKFSPLELVVQSSNMWLKRYVSDMVPVEYDSSSAVIRMQPTQETLTIRLIPPHMDGHNVVFPKRGFVPTWDVVIGKNSQFSAFSNSVGDSLGDEEDIESDDMSPARYEIDEGGIDYDSQLRIYCDLPGVPRKSIRVTKVGYSTLRILGEREQEFSKDIRRRSLRSHSVGGLYVSERKFGEFIKTLSVPVGFDIDAVETSMEDGVLKITMPSIQEEEEL